MEKISSILPSSRRVTSVDLKNSAPVRPGTPRFGRPEGTSSLREQPSVRTSSPLAEHNELMTRRSTSEDKAAIAQKMSDSFFMNRQKQSEETLSSPELYVEPKTNSYGLDAIIAEEVDEYLSELSAAQPSSESGEMDELDQPEVGRYLDLSV